VLPCTHNIIKPPAADLPSILPLFTPPSLPTHRLLNLLSVPLNALAPHARLVAGLNPRDLLFDDQEVRGPP
jgi:hypothetical protein